MLSHRTFVLFSFCLSIGACEGALPLDSDAGPERERDAGAGAAADGGPSVPLTPIDLTLRRDAVGAWGPIEVEASAPIVEGSIVVELTSDYGDTIPCDVRYDADARLITLVPDGLLTQGTMHSLHVSVRGPEGREGEVDARVRALRNSRLEVRALAADGDLDGLVRYRYADDGTALGYDEYGAGPDGVRGTPDDVVLASLVVIEAVRRREERGLVFPGPDGVFGTDDDGTGPAVLHRRDRYHLDEHGQTIRSEQMEAGPDDVLGTADDTIANYSILYRDGRGAHVAHIWYADPGLDGVLGTPDDVAGQYYEIEVDGVGDRIAGRRSLDPGPDGQWGTDDDTWDGWLATRELADGTELTYGVVAEPAYSGLYRTYIDELGRPTLRLFILGSGPDGEAGTDDDVIGGRHHFSYGEDGSLRRKESYYEGADGVSGTEDDALGAVVTYAGL